MVYSYGRGLIEGHELGQVGKNGRDERVFGRERGDYGRADVDRCDGVDRVAARDCEVVLVGFYGVEALGRGGCEGDDFVVEGKFGAGFC